MRIHRRFAQVVDSRPETAGINVPVRIGKATVMPGDLVFGDREGVNFIPPEAVERLIEAAACVPPVGKRQLKAQGVAL